MGKYYLHLNGKEIDPDTGKASGELLILRSLFDVEAGSVEEAKKVGEEWVKNNPSPDFKVTQIEIKPQNW